MTTPTTLHTNLKFSETFASSPITDALELCCKILTGYTNIFLVALQNEHSRSKLCASRRSPLCPATWELRPSTQLSPRATLDTDMLLITHVLRAHLHPGHDTFPQRLQIAQQLRKKLHHTFHRQHLGLCQRGPSLGPPSSSECPKRHRRN